MNEKKVTNEQEEVIYTFDDIVKAVQSELNEQSNGEVYLEPINIDISNLEGIKYNSKDFQKGISDYSYIAGVITALKNAGLDSENIVAYLTTDKVLENNLKVAEINKNADIEVAKQQNILIAKNQI